MDKIDLTKKNMTVEKAYLDQKNKGCYQSIFKKYKDPATRYAFFVLENKAPACEMIKLNAFRHLQDLRRITEDDSFEFYYDLDACRAVLQFAALCPGAGEDENMKLMLSQSAFLCQCQGWRSKDGSKRFQRAIFSEARTNGKTFVAGILSAYAYLIEADGKTNQDMLFFAPVATQSEKGFSYIRSIFNHLAGLPGFKQTMKKNNIRVVNDKVASNKTQNKILKLSDESGKFDSFHCLFAVSDEAGDDKSMSKIAINNGKVTSGQVQKPNSQFLMTSTAYPDSNSSLYSDEKMMRTAMKRDCSRVLDDFLCVVYEQDNLEETEKPELWAKSNPLLLLESKGGMLNKLISERDTFIQQGKIQEFQNKNLNMWLQVKQNSYLSLEDIEKAVVDEPPIDIKGREVYIGLDLSHFSDDTAVVFLFPYITAANVPKFYIYQHSWIPLARSQNNLSLKSEKDGINYQQAADAGFATIADGQYGYIDGNEVYNWILDFVANNQLKVKYFNYDSWETDNIVLRINKKTDWLTMPVRQGTKSLNAPTGFFRKQMDMNKITFLDDKIIQYSLKNALLYVDNNGIKIDKDKMTSKIDVADAIIDCFYSAMYYFDDINLEKEDKNDPFAGMDNTEINNYFKNDFGF